MCILINSFSELHISNSFFFFFFFFFLLSATTYFKVLACSVAFFHCSLSCATFLQLRRFMLFISSKMSSSHHSLSLPLGLLDMGVHFLIFFTMLCSVMRSTWPNHFSFCFLINLIMFCPFNI